MKFTHRVSCFEPELPREIRRPKTPETLIINRDSYPLNDQYQPGGEL